MPAGATGVAVGASRVPWDVPVRLVPAARVGSERRIRRVDPGVDLPGVGAVEVVTLREPGSGREVLIDLRPVRAASTGTTLADVLAELQDDADDRGDAAVAIAVDGTVFTRDVLTALARVPLGERRTYARLAIDAGRPRAVRAVASVMARNRVPLVLPCHRIVPTAGGTGRYAWGDDVKVALLDAESHASERNA